MFVVYDKVALKKITDEAELILSNYQDNLVNN